MWNDFSEADSSRESEQNVRNANFSNEVSFSRETTLNLIGARSGFHLCPGRKVQFGWIFFLLCRFSNRRMYSRIVNKC